MADNVNNSAAAMAASSPMKVETISMPGFAGGASTEFNVLKYKVRYGKYNLLKSMLYKSL